MTVLLVTGTSTDVGKTVVTAALAALAAGRVAVCKPAQTGVSAEEPGDLADVARLSRPTTLRELVRYPDPLAPLTAARRVGAPPLALEAVVDAVRELDAGHDLTLVEGAGGVLVRVGEWTLLDLAVALDAPVLVVAAAGLGTLNHTELTVQALAHRGVRCPGLVVGSWPVAPDLAQRCNLVDLPALSGVPLLGVLPAGSGALSRREFRVVAARSLHPSLGGAWTAPPAAARA